MKSFILLAVALLTAVARTSAVTVTVTDDTTANIALPRASYRSAATLNVAATLAGVSKRTYVKFDLSALPEQISGAKVERATLVLFCSTVKVAGTVNIAPVTSAWSEEILTGNQQPTIGAAEVTGVPVKLENKRRWISVDITSLVQDWVDGILPNHGIAITPEFSVGVRGVTASFDSKENAATGHSPSIEISLVGNGEAGPQGLPGAIGPVGPIGLQGLKGDRGDAGTPGAVGATGAQGATGLTGPQGLKGDKGDKGERGDTGATGPQGLIGLTGAAGPAGPAGTNGAPGIQGATGLQGIRGETGPAGPPALSGLTPTRLSTLRWYRVNTAYAATSLGAGSQPTGMCFDGTYMWVAEAGDNQLSKLRTDGTILTGNFPIAVSGSPQFCVSDGDYIWVTRKTINSVTRFNADTGASGGTIVVGTSPSHICFDGTFIWVANSTSLTKIKAADQTIQSGTYSVPNPRGMCFDGDNLWVCSFSGNAVLKLDPRNGNILGSCSVGTQPESICFDGVHIWVANQGSNNVSCLSLDGTIVGTYAVETSPTGIVFDGRAIWISNSGSNTVTQLNYQTGALIGSYPAGSSPAGLSFDGNAIWIASKAGNAVLRQ